MRAIVYMMIRGVTVTRAIRLLGNGGVSCLVLRETCHCSGSEADLVSSSASGIPLAFASTKVTGTEVVESTPSTLIFKMRCDYTFRLIGATKPVNSLITLTLDPDPDSRSDKDLEGKQRPDGKGPLQNWMETVKYHKDMWNQNDYSHEGLGASMYKAAT